MSYRVGYNDKTVIWILFEKENIYETQQRKIIRIYSGIATFLFPVTRVLERLIGVEK